MTIKGKELWLVAIAIIGLFAFSTVVSPELQRTLHANGDVPSSPTSPTPATTPSGTVVTTDGNNASSKVASTNDTSTTPSASVNNSPTTTSSTNINKSESTAPVAPTNGHTSPSPEATPNSSGVVHSENNAQHVNSSTDNTITAPPPVNNTLSFPVSNDPTAPSPGNTSSENITNVSA